MGSGEWGVGNGECKGNGSLTPMPGRAPQHVVMQREIGVRDASHSSLFGQSPADRGPGCRVIRKDRPASIRRQGIGRLDEN
jgi:hypothetical protein